MFAKASLTPCAHHWQQRRVELTHITPKLESKKQLNNTYLDLKVPEEQQQKIILVIIICYSFSYQGPHGVPRVTSLYLVYESYTEDVNNV